MQAILKEASSGHYKKLIRKKYKQVKFNFPSWIFQVLNLLYKETFAR